MLACLKWLIHSFTHSSIHSSGNTSIQYASYLIPSHPMQQTPFPENNKNNNKRQNDSRWNWQNLQLGFFPTNGTTNLDHMLHVGSLCFWQHIKDGGVRGNEKRRCRLSFLRAMIRQGMHSVGGSAVYWSSDFRFLILIF